MDRWVKELAVLGLVLAIVISSIAWPLTVYYIAVHRTAMEHGYEQVQEGISNPIWKKVK